MDASCVPPSVTPANHRVSLVGHEGALVCAPGQDVLNAVMRAGVAWLPVGCRGGGCGVCRVIVHSGAFTTGKMSRRLVASDDPATVFALACKLYPAGDLEIEHAPLKRSTTA